MHYRFISEGCFNTLGTDISHFPRPDPTSNTGAVKDNPSLGRGLGFAMGHLTFEPTARVQNRPCTPPEKIVEMFG